MTPTPQSIDLLLEARWIATAEQDGVLKNHAIAIDGGRILAILPIAEARENYLPREKTQLDEHILIPGLINLHTHAAMNLLRGIADDLPLMDWLQKRIWPAEGALVSSAFVLDGTRLACHEMLRGGVTCFSDMYFFPEAAAQAAGEFGMRAMLGMTTLEFPTRYASDAEDYLRKGLAARDANRDPRIHFALAPHAPYTVSDRSFERIATLAEQLDVPVHCHIHETRAEIEQSLAEHGVRPLARLHRLGLVNPDFIGVHAVHLDDTEIQLLAEQNASIAHCPTSNLKLGSGVARIADLLAAGVNVGLGSDGAASNNRLDMFQEMRLAALLAKGHGEDASLLPAAQILRMATINGARALGLAHLTGSLAPGKAADIVAVALGELDCQPCYDPLSHLIYVAGREQVSHVWIDGMCRIYNKTLQSPHAISLDASLALWQNRAQVCARDHEPS